MKISNLELILPLIIHDQIHHSNFAGHAEGTYITTFTQDTDSNTDRAPNWIRPNSASHQQTGHRYLGVSFIHSGFITSQLDVTN